MKSYLIICIVTCLMSSCKEDKHVEKDFSKQFDKKTIEKLNDSTTEYSFWINDNQAICYIVSKQDTVDKYRYSEMLGYADYAYLNEEKAIYKIQQVISIDGEVFPNESIYFNDKGEIINSESSFLKTKLEGDSIGISLNSGSNYFNKIRVIISDNENFNVSSWKIIDTIETFNSSVFLHKNYENKKCKFQAIKTDKSGRDESGKDFYFDLKNLICRDVKKSLICKDW